jgi:glutamate dehydrogenase
VDLSDHEVNLKILLAMAELEGAERDGILRGATKEVCDQVLRDNHEQARALSLEERRGAAATDDRRFFIDDLSEARLLVRAVEKIPGDQDLLRLRDAGLSLTRPELAVLLAYAKIDAVARVATAAPAADLATYVEAYFPREVSRRFADLIPRHRLHREIAMTAAVNDAVNSLGLGFFRRVARRTGCTFDRILHAYLIATALVDARDFHGTVDRAFAEGSAEADACCDALLRFAAAEEEVVLAALRRRPEGSAFSCAELYAAKVLECRAAAASEIGARAADAAQKLKGIPEAAVRALVLAERLAGDMDLADLRDEAGSPPAHAAVDAWSAAGAALLADEIATEALRMTRLSGHDIQTRASLLDRLRDDRRRLAAAMLRGLRERGVDLDDAGVCPIPAVVPADHPARGMVRQVLERARTREPLTPSGLFVAVEALGRMVDEASSGGPRSARPDAGA